MPVRRLDDLIREHNVTQIDFCKIDVEEFEKYVIIGLGDFEVRPLVFLIESQGERGGQRLDCNWNQMLFDHGYEFWSYLDNNSVYIDVSRKDELNLKPFDINRFAKKYQVCKAHMDIDMFPKDSLTYKVGNTVKKIAFAVPGVRHAIEKQILRRRKKFQ